MISSAKQVSQDIFLVFIEILDNGSSTRITENNVAYSPESNYNLFMEQESIIWLISSIRNKSNDFLRDKIKEENLKNLNTSHSALLSVLYSSGYVLPLQEVVKRLGRSKSTVTEMVKSAERAGYIEKIEDSEDKRALLIKLTGKAISIEENFNRISGELIKKTYEGFNDVEKAALINLLEKVYRNFE